MTSSRKKLPKVVIDTNLFISGLIIRRGYPYELLLKWRSQSFILVISQEQHNELIDVLSRPKISAAYNLSKEDIAYILFLIDTTAFWVFLEGRLPVKIRDPKDEKILDTAISGEADYLITGDRDLLVLAGKKALKGLKIVTALEFLSENQV